MTRALVAFGYGLILGFVLTALWARWERWRRASNKRELRRWHRMKALSEKRRALLTVPLLMDRSDLLTIGRERRN